jgi:ADP-heptose:LPS heptosyltransferase
MTPASILPNLPHQARILVVRLRSIGDIVLLTPALQLLKAWRPDLRVSVVVETRFRQLLEGNPDVEELLDPGEGKGWRKTASRVRAVGELRRRGFSLCVNLHGGPTSTFLTRFSGARWKAGFHHYRALTVYDTVIPDARTILGQPTLHTAEHQASAFFWLGLPRQAVPPARLLVAPHCRTWWEAKRERLGISRDQEYAVIHPAALYETKRWAPEHFAQVGAALERDAAIAPIYSCGPDESAVLDAVERAAAEPIRRLQDAVLGQFAAALAGARLFVGNDSGPAHMAAALGRPAVVIFGSSSSLTWGPWPPPGAGSPSQIVQNPYECNPCPGDRCYRFEHPECILSVTVPQVKAAIESVLERSSAASRGCG